MTAVAYAKSTAADNWVVTKEEGHGGFTTAAVIYALACAINPVPAAANDSVHFFSTATKNTVEIAPALTSAEPYYIKPWTMADLVKNNLQVKQFKQLVPHTDEVALVALCELTFDAFKDVAAEPEFRVGSHEADELPNLFVKIDTRGLDLDALIDRELALRAHIAQHDRLRLVSNYVTLSIV
ncbi:MAG TPA: hypothetical protein VFY31_07225 [Macromonas sp.]|nr:hypothetical protein [Macromonas sp.]